MKRRYWPLALLAIGHCWLPQTASAFTDDTLGNVRDDGNRLTVSTSYAWEEDELSLWLSGDAGLLDGLGVEGSAARWQGLSAGYYELDWMISTAEKNRDFDAFYLWDGETVKTLATRSQATGCVLLKSGRCSSVQQVSEVVTSTVKLMRDAFAVIAMDTVNAYGTSALEVLDLRRVGDLAPEDQAVANANAQAALAVAAGKVDRAAAQGVAVGSVRSNPVYDTVGTGYGSVPVKGLEAVLGEDLSGLGTGGSFSQWQLVPGRYEFRWQLASKEHRFDYDAVYWWNGDRLQLWAERAIADELVGTNQWESDWLTTTLDITGEFGLLALNTGDLNGSTDVRVASIRQVPREAQQTPEPLLGWSMIAMLLPLRWLRR